MARKLERIPLRELRGRKVRLLLDMETKGGTILGRGTVMVVEGKFQGLALERAEVCPHCRCGHRQRIARVPYGDVDLVADDEQQENGNG